MLSLQDGDGAKSRPGTIPGTIDKASPVPYYYQLLQLLERGIASGAFAPGEKIPTEAALCEHYDVSRTVVRQALSDLDRTGLVTRHKGKGTFVASPKVSEFVAQSLTSLHEDLSARGVRLDEIVAYFDAGATVVALGSGLVGREAPRTDAELERITAEAARATETARQAVLPAAAPG